MSTSSDRGVTLEQARAACSRAAVYLVGARCGFHWEDYRLPVGVSDAWVTAYAALSLCEAGPLLDDATWAGDAVRRAADWLLCNRCAIAGWGYNAKTGPDADSTGYALLLLRRLGLSVEGADGQLLRRWFGAAGGFATYEGPAHWGDAHPDVTPVAYAALLPAAQASIRSRVLEYVLRVRAPDGTWPAYWWRSNHYSTWLNLSLLGAEGIDVARGLDLSALLASEVRSAFDLAFVVGTAALQAPHDWMTGQLALMLLGRQQTDGRWEGDFNLRVTDSACAQPWIAPRGALFRDERGIVTTASALRVLAQFAGAIK